MGEGAEGRRNSLRYREAGEKVEWRKERVELK